MIKEYIDKSQLQSYRSNWEQNDPNAKDYVLNRTHYIESKEEDIEIFSAIPWSELISNDYIENTKPLIEGKTYKIIGVNKPLEFVAKKEIVDGDTIVYIGDINLESLQYGFVYADLYDPEAEPISVFGLLDEDLAISILGTIEPDTPINLIQIGEQKIKKLDNKFLDLAWIPEITYSTQQQEFSIPINEQIEIDYPLSAIIYGKNFILEYFQEDNSEALLTLTFDEVKKTKSIYGSIYENIAEEYILSDTQTVDPLFSEHFIGAYLASFGRKNCLMVKGPGDYCNIKFIPGQISSQLSKYFIPDTIKAETINFDSIDNEVIFEMEKALLSGKRVTYNNCPVFYSYCDLIDGWNKVVYLKKDDHQTAELPISLSLEVYQIAPSNQDISYSIPLTGIVTEEKVQEMINNAISNIPNAEEWKV